MSGSGPGPASPRGLTTYVAASVVAAVVVVAGAWTVGAAPDPTAGHAPWFVGLLTLATLAGCMIHVEVRVRATLEATTLSFVALVPVAVLLPPGAAVATCLAGVLVAEALLTRLQLQKMAFNVSWHVIGVALASSVHHAISHGGMDGRATLLASGLLAALVLVLVNTVAFAGVVSLMSGKPIWLVLAEDEPSWLFVEVGTAGTGLLAAVLLVQAPLALPLLAVPLVLDRQRARARSTAYDRLASERDLFVQAVDGASDGVVLLDRRGAVEIWNSRMVDLTGVPAQQVLGRTLVDGGMTAIAEAATSGRETPVELAAGMVMVRRSRPRGGRGASVLTLRDVTREAELARIREDLVSRISHEIRTPVTTVSGFVRMLDERWDELPERQRRGMVAAAVRGADRLWHLVENLVTLSLAESRLAGAAAVHDDRMVSSVGEALHDTLTSLQLSGVTVTGDPSARAAITRDDLRVVLRNLLSNAAAYGEPPIEVDVRRRGTTVEVAVTDHGPGVPPDFTTRLFRPFHQASEGDQRTAQGMGIGLAVVHSLVVGGGGSVRHEPVDGGGVRFVVALPARAGRDPRSTPSERTMPDPSPSLVEPETLLVGG